MTTLRGAALHAGQAHQLGIDVGRQADVAWLVGGVRPSGTLQSACQPSVRGLQALGAPSSSASPDLAPPSNSGRTPPPIGEGHTIDALGYRVNVAARNLRAGRTGTIGLAVPDLDRAYTGELAARIVRAGRQRGLRVVVEETGARKENELDAIALSRVRMYDGMIMSAVGIGGADLEQMGATGPVVLLGERFSVSPVDHVGVPNVAGTRALVEHLLATGRRRIAVVGAPPGYHRDPDRQELDAALLRIRGYREALAAAGIEADPALVVEAAEWSMAGGADATRRLLRHGPACDAILGLTDSLAIGALRALADAGLPVPERIAVAGFDDVAESQFVVPRLTTVAPDHEQIAQTALRFLEERIAQGNGPGPGRDVTSDFRVMVRESTGEASG